MPGAEPFRAPAREGAAIGVLLSHGFTGTPQSMLPWAQHLAAQGWAVRLPRLPGHGTRWQDLNRTGWQDWLAVLERELHDLRREVDHVVLGGLSLGGALVTRLAETHGRWVDGVVLVNPALTNEDPRLRILPVLRRVVPSIPAIGGDIRKEGVTELAYDRTPLHALASMRQLWTLTIRDLGRVTAPLLVCRSDVDHVVPRSSVETLLAGASSPDVTMVDLHESYHVATLDHDAPRIFEAADGFVRRVCGEVP